MKTAESTETISPNPIPMTKLRVILTFTEPLLGTLAADPNIAEEYIRSKAKTPEDQAEERSAQDQDAEFERTQSIFARHDGKPMLWDYQIKGFLKEAALAMIESRSMTQEALKPYGLTPYVYKRTVDTLIFILPRRIILTPPKAPNTDSFWLGLPNGAKGLKLVQRPLRKENPRGGKVCLVASEAVPAGTSVELCIVVLRPNLLPFVEQWLNYGELKGIGQWRNGSFGRFTWAKA